MTTTHTLETPRVDIAYDVYGPLPTADGRPSLFMIGWAHGRQRLATLASHFPDRTVVTHDPRGLGRSVRKDGRVDHAPTVQAGDVHAVIEALGVGPSTCSRAVRGGDRARARGGTSQRRPPWWHTSRPHPGAPRCRGRTCPPRRSGRVRGKRVECRYGGLHRTAFVARRVTDEYFAQPMPDPGQFGMPNDDDGSRGDPLLSDRSWAVSSYRPDVDALAAAPTRIDCCRARSRWARLLDARRWPPPNCSASRPPCSQPPRRLHGWRVRYAGQPEAFGAQAARRPRRHDEGVALAVASGAHSTAAPGAGVHRTGTNSTSSIGRGRVTGGPSTCSRASAAPCWWAATSCRGRAGA